MMAPEIQDAPPVMTNEKWHATNEWVRTIDGKWINTRTIQAIYVELVNEEYSICAKANLDEDLRVSNWYTLKEGFATQSQAQNYLDHMKLFYEKDE